MTVNDIKERLRETFPDVSSGFIFALCELELQISSVIENYYASRCPILFTFGAIESQEEQDKFLKLVQDMRRRMLISYGFTMDELNEKAREEEQKELEQMKVQGDVS